MRRELENRGLETILPYIEVYGHWNNDETKLETELYMCLKYEVPQSESPVAGTLILDLWKILHLRQVEGNYGRVRVR